jgi:trigger factor
LDFSVPVADVVAETGRVVAELAKSVRLPGFRPGKAPAAVIRKRFANEIRQDVLEAIVPRVFRQRAEQDNLNVVGQPAMADVHFHDGEPLTFKVEFEIMPEFELGEYRGLTVPFDEPSVEDTDVEQRMERLRDAKADYVNIDPRPLADGDYAVVSLHSIAGVEGEPIANDEMMLHIGGDDTMPEFTENLRGSEPGQEKQIEVNYPDNYAHHRLAGKRVTFQVNIKGLRRKELPELDDAFAAEAGDFKDVAELQTEIRKAILAERQQEARSEAKSKLIDTLVDAHSFPVPETFIDRQIETMLESRLRELAANGIDPRNLNLDWHKIRDSQKEQAARDVKGSLLLEKIADREAIETLNDEVDKEVHRLARQLREPAAAVRMRLEKDGTLSRIASRIRTEKVLNFLFENATKVAKPEPAA